MRFQTVQLSFAAFLALLFAAAQGMAETFTTRDDFTLTLPSGWAEAPPEAMRQMEATLEQMSQGANKEKYDYGYQLATASIWFEYPYILVQVNRNGRVREGQLTDYQKLDSEMAEGLKEVEESLGGFVSDMKQGETLYDEADHMLWSAMTSNIQGVGNIRAIVAVKFTEFGFIQLMAYATEDQFAEYAPIFREAAQSLTVSDEYTYQPRITDHAPTIWGINLGRSAIAGLVGAAIGGAVGLIVYARRK